MLTLLFNQNSSATITGSMVVTDSPDIVAFAGDFPVFGSFALFDAIDRVSMSGVVTHVGWVPASPISTSWARSGNPSDTWTPTSLPADIWVGE